MQVRKHVGEKQNQWVVKRIEFERVVNQEVATCGYFFQILRVGALARILSIN